MKPALTAEQWEQQESEVAYLDHGLTVQAEPRDEDYASVNIPDGVARHGLAALALYGQPFGFTREDVKVLRQVARGDWGMEAPDPVTMSIADRIEALLPPEG